MLYLTSDQLPVFIPLGLIGCYRYLWYFIRLSASFCYSPIPIPENPTYYSEQDVTIIVPTIDADESFADAARSWLANHPREIIIVTESSVSAALEKLAIELDGPPLDPELRDQFPHSIQIPNSNTCTGRLESENPKKGRIRVITVPKANKRLQMAAGIEETRTDIIVFADDDALWPKTLLASVLACFEDQSIGGVGTSQVVKPCHPSGKLTVWETLAAFRLTIRNIEISASTHIDGGIPCLSGRTAAYRTLILKDPEFLHGFTHDFWRGKYHLNSGDDKFLTRWMVSHGWRTYAQCCPEAELQSTMKPDWRFLKQVLRWTRNTWRSDMRSMFMERHVWTLHPYVAFTMVDKFINPFTLLAGPCLVLYLMIRSSAGNAPNGFHLPAYNIIISYITWLLITRTLKLIPHLYRRPQDIIYIPVWLIFGYYFAVMKLYALFTLHVTGWGTREGIDDPTVATAAAESQQNQRQHHPIQTQTLQKSPSQRLQYFQERHRPSSDYEADPSHLGNRSHEDIYDHENEYIDSYNTSFDQHDLVPSHPRHQVSGLDQHQDHSTSHGNPSTQPVPFSNIGSHSFTAPMTGYKAKEHDATTHDLHPLHHISSTHSLFGPGPHLDLSLETSHHPSHESFHPPNPLHQQNQYIEAGLPDPRVEISITSPDMRRRRYYY